MFDIHTTNLIFSVLSPYSISLTILIALTLDWSLGEAKKYHYLIGFGWLSQQIEKKLNPDFANKNGPSFKLKSLFLGVFSWVILVSPLPIIYMLYITEMSWYWQIFIDAIVLYLAIGLTSLEQHAMQVYRPLQSNDLTTARHFTGYLVSRDTDSLTSDDMARATTESMLENGHDSVIASLFYYTIGGAPLVIIHRLANTLDAMWGYKTARFNAFGYASARLDDILGFISGKVCTLLYAIQKPFLSSLKNAYYQGNQYKSHNGGWVMAAGATVLNRTLGGSANYHGKQTTSVTLGMGLPVTLEDIPSSIIVIKRSVLILLFITAIVETIQLLTVHLVGK